MVLSVSETLLCLKNRAKNIPKRRATQIEIIVTNSLFEKSKDSRDVNSFLGDKEISRFL